MPKKTISKIYKDLSKKYTPEEIAESFVFPGPKDKKRREAMLAEFRIFRKTLKENQTEESKTTVRLLQLRFLIEDGLL